MKKNLNILFILITLISLDFKGYAQTLPVACGGSTEWYGVVGDNGNSDFDWEVVGGTILRNYNDSILVQWNTVAGAHELRVTERNLLGCYSEQLVQVVIITAPFVDVGLDADICEGTTHTFDVETGAITSLLWQDGSSGETFIASESGDYWVRVEDEFGCVNSDTASLIVHDLPQIDLGPDTTLCDPQGIITFEALGYSTVNWLDGEGISPTFDVYSGNQDQVITVTVSNDFGCEGSDTVVVRFCGEIKIPNAFSPNDDRTNQEWVIEDLYDFPEATIDVYNRWGERVFHSTGYSSDKLWDGTGPKGKKLPMDSYYYVIDLRNGEEPIVGTVTIIR